MEFLGDRRAADDRPALEHGDLEPRGGEIGRRDQAIVTPADDDDVGHCYARSRPAPGMAVGGVVDPDSLTARVCGKTGIRFFAIPAQGQNPIGLLTPATALGVSGQRRTCRRVP